MNYHMYVCNTAAQFRKKYPELYERKEKKPVFIDFSLLDEIKDIPKEIKAELIKKTKVTRLCRTDFAINIIDEDITGSGYHYYLDIDCSCYDIYKNDKMLYSVLHIDAARWNVYKSDIYRHYNNLPEKSGELNWDENMNYKLNRIDIDSYESEAANEKT